MARVGIEWGILLGIEWGILLGMEWEKRIP